MERNPELERFSMKLGDLIDESGLPTALVVAELERMKFSLMMGQDGHIHIYLGGKE